MKTQLPGHYTHTQAAALLCCSKEAVAVAAKRNGWPQIKVGNVKLLQKEDVRDYRDHRYRTQLVKALDWSGRGLYRNKDIDIECPECGAFAVMWPAPPEIPTKFMCLKGHEGKRKF